MDNVIYYSFKQRSKILPNDFLNRFCQLLKDRGLCDDDIAEVIDGINSYQHYQSLEPVLQHIVNVYNDNVKF
jgi:hypothetical protein